MFAAAAGPEAAMVLPSSAVLPSSEVLVLGPACSWVRPIGLHQRCDLVHDGLGYLVFATLVCLLYSSYPADE